MNQYLHIYITLLGMLTLSSSILSQEYFSKRFDLDQGNEWGSSIIPVDDGLIVQVKGLCEINQRICHGIMKFDFSGELIWEAIVYDSLETNFFDATTVRNDTIFVNMNYIDVEGKQYAILMFDKEGQYLAKHDYWDDGLLEHHQHWARGIESDANHLFVNFTYRDSITGSPVEALRVYDNEWNIMWEHVFPGNNQPLIRCDIEVANDGGVVAIYSTRINDDDDITATVEKYTSEGFLEWSVLLPFVSTYKGTWVRIANHVDGGYAGIWRVDTFAFAIADNPSMVFKIDSDGVLEWDTIDWATQFNLWDVFVMADGGIVACGVGENFYNDTIDESDFRTGYIVKYTSDGAKLWERRIFDTIDGAYTGQLIGGMELLSNDLVFVGVIDDSIFGTPDDATPSNVWLLKLDSEGCILSDCDDDQYILTGIKDDLLESHTSYTLFPNPTSGFVTIKNMNTNTSWSRGCQMNFISSNGKILKSIDIQDFSSDIVVNVNELPNGVYYVSMKCDGFLTQVVKMIKL